MNAKSIVRAGVIGLLWAVVAVPATVLIGSVTGQLEAAAQSGTIRSVKVSGNKRVEPETVRSYLEFGAGDRYDPILIDNSLKALFATGLFSDVRIRFNGGVVTVTVVENPIIHRVAFEGNKEVDDDALAAEVQLKSRSIYTRARVKGDVQRIIDVYRRQGLFAARVEPKIIQLPHNRVDLVFEITEGVKTTVRSINFVGNAAFSDSQLREVITTSETGLLSFFKPTNIYDPDRLNLDRELLRQFYLKSGYADIRILSAVADLDSRGRGFRITFTLEEGEQYRFGTVDIETALAIDPEVVGRKVTTKPGKIYDATRVEKSVEHITVEVASRGYAFARVRPRVDRDPVARVINLTYVIEEGPRVYIERIDIVGNTRTLDEVIRREFRLAEGDAYNRLLVENARKRLVALRFFKSVKVTPSPGSARDRIVLTVVVVEQATGELSFGAGYSSAEGLIGDISLTERNLLGKGQYVRLRLSGSFERTQIDFSFTEPRFLDRNMSAGIDIFHRESDLTDESSFKSRRTGGGVRLGVPLSDYWAITTRYQFENQEVFDIQPGASLAVQNAAGTTIKSSVGYTLVFDTRNNRRSPTQGYYFALTQDIAGVGGDVNFVRTVADARAYYPVRKKVTLVGRIQGGNISGFGGEQVRLQDLFFKGSETIRGFDRAGIGPRDLTTGDALGGRTFAAATAELRFPLPFIPESLGMSGAVFTDAATLFDTGDLGNLNVSNVGDEASIRSSAGFSLIWQSPVGPLRADIAGVLSSESFDEEQVFRFGGSTQF